jgi:thiol-disulfide isomerase/thioredoxin
MAKKGKRVRRADSPLRWWLKQNQRWVRRLGVFAALAVLAVALWFVVDPLQGPPTAITESGDEVKAGVVDTPGATARIGSRAPNFVLPDYDQKAVYLDEFEGKVVFVNFWASWCTFCEQEMPDIIRLAERFPNDLVVLAVNRGESKGTAKGWSDGHAFPDLANVHWLLDQREDVVHEYRVEGMPQSFFIDANGTVHQELRRVTDYDEIRDTLETMLQLGDQQAVGL